MSGPTRTRSARCSPWRTRCSAAGPGGAVIASFGDDPFEVPGNLRFLPGCDLLSPPAQYPARPQVMVTFDAASADRLGSLAPAAARADELIVLDHHASNAGFGTRPPGRPGGGRDRGARPGADRPAGRRAAADIATGLYAGLVTDTGSFRFSTTPQVHLLAAELHRYRH